MDYNLGHRARIREKLLSAKIGTLPDYEILELILCLAIPRKDTKPLAKELLAKYGSIAKVINADLEDLRSFKGVGESTIACFKMILEASHRITRDEIKDKPILSSWQSLISYCRSIMGHSSKEMFVVFFLNSQNHLIEEEIFDYGTVDQISVYPREIAKKALFHNATAIILAHNHPAGNAKASKADIEITRKLVTALEPFNIKIHDHVIITDNSFYSFKSEGLL
jgi:DNA repair protein RadC